jgi:hypothetical protein
MAEQQSTGIILLLAGVVLVLFNRPIAEVNKAAKDWFWMGSTSLRSHRVGTIVVGVIFALVGSLLLLGIARIRQS